MTETQTRREPPSMPKFPETHLIREGGPKAAIVERRLFVVMGLAVLSTVAVLLYEILR